MTKVLDPNMQQEAHTARMMTETPSRRSFVLVITVEGGGPQHRKFQLARSTSDTITYGDLDAFRQVLIDETNMVQNFLAKEGYFG